MQSFNHRMDRRPRSSKFSNDVESQPPVPKRIRGRNKMHKPRNGQIVIIPEGDNQFRYANYSIDDKIKKGPILGVLLKEEYPPIIEGTTRDGRPFKYHASKWEHYSHIISQDGETPADRVKQEFWDDYNEALQKKYPENWEEQPFDGQIAYNIGRGLPHGRLAIGDGAVKKGTIIDVAKASGRRLAMSRVFQNLMARYEESVATVGRLTQQNTALAQQNATLTRDVKRNGRVLELIINKVQIEIPPDLLQEEENEMGGAIDGSSHASANLDNSDGH